MENRERANFSIVLYEVDGDLLPLLVEFIYNGEVLRIPKSKKKRPFVSAAKSLGLKGTDNL